MIRKCFLCVAAMAVAVLLISGCRGETASPQKADIKDCIPADSDLRGWERDGETQIFKGEDLYLYIDGGADIYLEYGFAAVAVQDYKGSAGKSLSLEVFQMKDAAAAFGMYTFKTSAGGKAIGIGGRGQLEDYYLNFWKGIYVVTLTGFDEEEATIQGLSMIGRAVDAKILSKGQEPFLPSLLPQEGLNRQSVKYIRGLIGLNNIYSFFPRKVFSFDEGAKGDYQDNARLLVLSLNDVRQAEAALGAMSREVQAGERYRNFRMTEPYFLQVEDDKGQLIHIARFEKYLLITIGSDWKTIGNLIRLAMRGIEQ